MSAVVVDLAEWRALRERERQRQAELILCSPPLFWWELTMWVWMAAANLWRER